MVGVLVGRVVLEYVHLKIFQVASQAELHPVGADDLLAEIAEDGEGKIVLLGQRQAVVGSLGADGDKGGAKLSEAGERCL